MPCGAASARCRAIRRPRLAPPPRIPNPWCAVRAAGCTCPAPRPCSTATAATAARRTSRRNDEVAAPPAPAPAPGDPSFLRLWHAFLTARVVVALALLVLLMLDTAVRQAGNPLLPAAAATYLVATVLLRLLGRHRPPAPQPGLHWLPSIGVDIALIGLLQSLQAAGSVNFTPLFGLPLLLA